jgi:hypothetical protein
MPEEYLTECPAGNCLGANWYCCPDNVNCADLPENCDEPFDCPYNEANCQELYGPGATVDLETCQCVEPDPSSSG